MIEELKSTDIVNKIGGKFRLTSLMQKRMVELMNGSRPLIKDTEGMTMMEIVIQEIKHDKICVEDAPSSKPKEMPTL